MLAVQIACAQEPRTAPLRGFGVATHLSSHRQGWKVEHLLPLMKQLGISFIRDEIPWSAVEKERGVYALRQDEQDWVDAVEKADIQIVIVLDYGNKLYENPLDADAFANFAAWMAKHFKGDPHIMAFEIWNEPNNFYFLKKYGGMWNGKDDAPWIEKFAELVEKASAAIRREDPDRTIITGYGVPPASLYGMQRFPQSWKNVDGLTDHPYTFSLPPERVPFGGAELLKRDGVAVADDDSSMTSLFRRQQEAAEKYLGRSLPLWCTEFGYSTFHRLNPHVMYAGFSEQAQAAYHARGLVQALACGVKAWCIYDLMDDGVDPANAEHHFGLVRNEKFDYAPKPAFDALRRIAELLGPNWQYVDAPPAAFELNQPVNTPAFTLVHDQQPITLNAEPRVYWFQTPTQVIAFVWMTGRYQNEFSANLGRLTWPAASPPIRVRAINIVTGTSVPLSTLSDGGQFRIQRIPVGSDPVAVIYSRF